MNQLTQPTETPVSVDESNFRFYLSHGRENYVPVSRTEYRAGMLSVGLWLDPKNPQETPLSTFTSTPTSENVVVSGRICYGVPRQTEIALWIDPINTFYLRYMEDHQDEDGYVPFNEFRELGQNQYASRYAHGRIAGYPDLGHDLRWKNLESGNYHNIRIHISDLLVFHYRVKKASGGR